MTGIKADTVFKKRIPYICIQDFIYIFLLQTRGNGIKIIWRFHGIGNGNISRQMCIYGQGDPVSGNCTVRTEICAVYIRMDA